MSITSFRRPLVLVLLVLASTALPASAAGQSPVSPRLPAAAAAAPLDVLGRLWSFLATAWSDTGCRIDPSGQCAPGTAAPPALAVQGDEGCRIDPSGQCHG